MKYVRNAWYVAAWSHDMEAERPRRVQILNEPIVVWRAADGTLSALEDRCLHRLAPLSLGRCEGEKLRCRYHGLLYDRGGRVVEIPGQARIPASFQVRTYPVAERHGWVWLWMGDEEADEDLIPPLWGADKPGYVFGRGQLDYAAQARFICENLLDLSHVSYLHTATFRMSESWAREHPRVSEIDRGVLSERWFRSEGVNGKLESKEPVDTYFRYEFFVPGALLMTHWTCPVGTADALNGQRPDLGDMPDAFTSQAITPLSDNTARYFYLMADRRKEGRTSYDMTATESAFAEDKAMIEAQQRNVDVTPGWRFRSVAGDRGIALFSRLTEKLAGGELPDVAYTARESRGR